MPRSSCRLPLAARDTASCRKARQVGHFRPDKCPCGLPWDQCPWRWDRVAGSLDNPHALGRLRSCGGTGPPAFRCPRCGAVSYNPNDIRENYCGRCHVFVDDQAKPVRVPLLSMVSA
jgi:hypothetical protein